MFSKHLKGFTCTCIEQKDAVGQASLVWHLKKSMTIPMCNTMKVTVGETFYLLLPLSVWGVLSGQGVHMEMKNIDTTI